MAVPETNPLPSGSTPPTVQTTMVLSQAEMDRNNKSQTLGLIIKNSSIREADRPVLQTILDKYPDLYSIGNNKIQLTYNANEPISQEEALDLARIAYANSTLFQNDTPSLVNFAQSILTSANQSIITANQGNMELKSELMSSPQIPPSIYETTPQKMPSIYGGIPLERKEKG